MRSFLQDRLFRRELDGGVSRFSSIPGIYGDKYWANNLDIVNELGGHHGCVNALSWSKSGRLLASGSDDTNILIHRYQPEQSTAPFVLSTSIATGHSANIFSVKFMPHSNDNTLITAAGDSEVRVFDVEYSAQPRASALNQPVGLRHGMRSGVNYLNEHNANSRIYRSHGDRVKRIVTESSPHLFMTCSEDGEVRQWDLRLPSSAYPSPFAGARDDSNFPPPLISYKKWRIDLNSISCSANQPHYILIGGSHLHCFLHDRRMLGRDILSEQGSIKTASSTDSGFDDESMGLATQCVRRFAPNGQRKMGPRSNGHVTACKISDSNPNEMIASWSGDHIYSFDLIRSPDALEHSEVQTHEAEERKKQSKHSRDRKRKRKQAVSPRSQEPPERRTSRPRNEDDSENGDISVRIRYDNGQYTDTAIAGSAVDSARESMLDDAQKRSFQIARGVVRLRRLLFSLQDDERTNEPSTAGATEHGIPMRPFISALELAASLLSDMDEVITSWTYPIDPVEDEITLHTTLRSDRDAGRRFVQAAGTLSNFLKSDNEAHVFTSLADDLNYVTGGYFPVIQSPSTEGPFDDSVERFRYDFLKSIISWLSGGIDALYNDFCMTPERRRHANRFPIPEGSEANYGGRLAAIDGFLVPYLERFAGSQPIKDVDASRFEIDEHRIIFQSERAAVRAFSDVVKTSGYSREGVALRFWGFKIGRGLLLNAAQKVNFRLVDIAFGGLGETPNAIDSGRTQADIDPDDVDLEVAVSEYGANAEPDADAGNGGDESSDDEDDNEIDDDSEQEADDDDEEAVTIENRQILWRSSSERARLRADVASNVPVDRHTRKYVGHVNVKTVKDVGFFGLNDEYVVSGSDSGHVFIWDRKTSKLVNILEGDREVVNVVQGHPYEPLLAVSGIDHTIKCFSADNRAQRDAHKGINVTAQQSAGYSTLGYHSAGRRLPRRHSTRPDISETDRAHTAITSATRFVDRSQMDDEEVEDEPEDDTLGPRYDGLSSKKRMHDSYQIMTQNDVERQGGMREAYITRGMLAQLAQQMRMRRRAVGQGDGDNEGTVVVDENCSIM